MKFTYWRCATPTITSTSPDQGTATDDVVIYGTGFSHTCQISVTIGESECGIWSSNDTTIVCRIKPDLEPAIALPLYVTVSVKNRGFAVNLVQNDVKRHFVLLPHVSNVSPNTGSIHGGCSVTVTGGGFQGKVSDVSVTIGDMKCDVTEVSYTKIRCNTSSTFASSYNVSVTVKARGLDVPAFCSSGNCSFTVSDAFTPKVTSLEPANITSVNQSIVVNGEKFGTDLTNVEIYIGSVMVNVDYVFETTIVFKPTEVIVGTQPVIIKILDKGLAIQTKFYQRHS